MKIKYLPLLSTENLTLVEFIQILTAFYHLLINLVLYTRVLIDTELLFLKQLFLKNGYSEML